MMNQSIFSLLRNARKNRRVRAASRPPQLEGTHRLEKMEERCLFSLTPFASLPVGVSPNDVVTADFNADSHLDLAWAYSDTGGGAVNVLLGDGAGGFAAMLPISIGLFNTAMSVGDFNKDGRPDLVVADRTTGVNVLLNLGNSTFGGPVHTGQLQGEAATFDIADFNRDGNLDLAVATNDYSLGDSGLLELLYGDGTGAFGASTVVNTSFANPGSPAAGDFNGDGYPDLAIVDLGYGYGWPYESYVGIYLNDRAGGMYYSFGWTDELDATLAVGDFTGDGKLDIVNGGYAVTVTQGLGNGEFDLGAQVHHLAYDGLWQFAVTPGDFNADGKLDVLMSNGPYGAVNVMIGSGDGSLGVTEDALLYEAPFNYAIGDFNGDGWLDAAATIASESVIALLINDADWSDVPVPTLAAQDVTVTEGNAGTKIARFTVNLSEASTRSVSVNYEVAGNTATAGSDFQSAMGTVIFAPGETSKSIDVVINGDTQLEGDETFVIYLRNPSGAAIADNVAVGTILNDDVAPVLSIGDVTRVEGHKGRTSFTFTVSLSAPATQTVTVSYATYSGTALAGFDFSGKSGTLTFKPGQMSKTITIQVNGDRIREADEVFYVDLFGNSSNSLITRNRGIGTILNDD